MGGLDAELEWAHVLSLGEQQRVAFLRLLLHAPALAFLDEVRRFGAARHLKTLVPDPLPPAAACICVCSPCFLAEVPRFG